MRRMGMLVLVLGLAAACGGGGGGSGKQDQAAASAGAVVTEPPHPKCTDLVGMPTSEVVALAEKGCDDGSTVFVTAAASYDCLDGRKLYWHDKGWGWSDGKWQAHARPDGQLVPPDAAMTQCKGPS